MKDLGKRIQQLRIEQNISMAELSKAINVSRSLISQVEKGVAYPSLQTLEKIVNALGITLSQFFEVKTDNTNEGNVVVRSGTRKVVTMQDSRHKYHILAPSLYNEIEFVIAEFPPFMEGDEYDYFQHDGEEYFYVLSGQVQLTVGDETYILNEDDSGCFKSSIKHYYVNKSDKSAKVIVAASEHGL